MDEVAKYDTDAIEAIEPMRIIKDAVLNNDIPVDKLQALFDLETRVQEREAKKEFTRAIAKFQHECPIVEKGDDAHGKKYARMDRIWRTIRPLIRECGLALTWESCTFNRETKVCILDGTISHISGYSKPIHSEIAIPEKITGQNSAQVDGSAQSYAKRYATSGVLGIYTGQDDDGNGGAGATITKEQAMYVDKLMIDSCMSEAIKNKLFEFAGCDVSINIPPAKYTRFKARCEKELRSYQDSDGAE
jgi:hypothetical protein